MRFYLATAALLFGALHKLYPPFVHTFLEWWAQGGKTASGVFLMEAAALGVMAVFGAGLLVPPLDRLRQGSGAQGRALMGLGVALLVLWKFGPLIILKVSFGMGIASGWLLDEGVPALQGPVVFWTAMALLLAGILRALLAGAPAAAVADVREA